MSSSRTTMLRALSAVLALIGVVGLVRAHEQPKEGACAAALQQPALVSAREVLQRAPDSLEEAVDLDRRSRRRAMQQLERCHS